jgi:hypothetical protein
MSDDRIGGPALRSTSGAVRLTSSMAQ